MYWIYQKKFFSIVGLGLFMLCSAPVYAETPQTETPNTNIQTPTTTPETSATDTNATYKDSTASKNSTVKNKKPKNHKRKHPSYPARETHSINYSDETKHYEENQPFSKDAEGNRITRTPNRRPQHTDNQANEYYITPEIQLYPRDSAYRPPKQPRPIKPNTP